MRPTERLTGPTLSLRPLEASDAAEAYIGWLHDPLVTRYLEARFTDYTVDHLRAYIERENNSPDAVPFAMVTEPDGTFIGTIKLSRIRPAHLSAQLGLMIGARQEWGRGHGTAAIELACQYAFDTLGLHRIAAGCYASNPGSASAFLKAGFIVEGRLLQDRWSEGGWVDTILLGRLNPRAVTPLRANA